MFVKSRQSLAAMGTESRLMQTQHISRLRRNEASAYLKTVHGIDRKPASLATMATRGGGPRFQYVGKYPTYTPEELDIWAKAILSPPCSSTADKPRPDREVEDRRASSTEAATQDGGS
jgi:hypothetical protein